MFEIKIDQLVKIIYGNINWLIILDHDSKLGTYSDIKEENHKQMKDIYEEYKNRLTLFCWEK